MKSHLDIVKAVNDQLIIKLEPNELIKVNNRLKTLLNSSDISKDAQLPIVLNEMLKLDKYTIVIDAVRELDGNHDELEQWLHQQELNYLMTRLEIVKTNNNIHSETSLLTETSTRQASNLNIVEINGVRVELKFKPYRFQVTLSQLGCDGSNNIVCVRTGSGKTLIAALICKYWVTKLTSGTFHAAFIVPTRHLASQQMSAFHMAGFELDDLQEIKENTNEARTAIYLRERQVVFMTAQKLVNALKQGCIGIQEINLLIFDECHHATENHPYNNIMAFYHLEKERQQQQQYSMLNRESKTPMILGLTASLGVGRVNDAGKHLTKLCVNLDCNNVAYLKHNEDLDDLNANIPSPLGDKIIAVEFGPNGLIEFMQCLKTSSSQFKKILEWYPTSEMGTPDYERALHENKAQQEIGYNQTKLVAIKHLIDLNLTYLRAKDLPLESCLEYMAECRRLKYAQLDSNKIMERICAKSLDSLIDTASKNINNEAYENTKLKKLIQVILDCHKNTDCRGLILLRTRHAVVALEKYLNKHPSLIKKNIRAIKLLGQNNNEDGIGMNENGQKKAIEAFRDGECNLMVATDIAQEGLDVPRCNYVVRYEFVSNEIGTVQSRGRARAMAGQLFLITEYGGINYKREEENRIRETEMQQALRELDMGKVTIDLNNNKLKKSASAYSTTSAAWPSPNGDDDDLVNDFCSLFMSPLPNTNNKMKMSTSMSTLALGQVSSPKKQLASAHLYHVHCRHCNAALFPASDLRWREPAYYSVNKEFMKPDSIRVDTNSFIYYCNRNGCNSELGRQVVLRRADPLYMIDIQGIKFSKKGTTTTGDHGFIVVNKWSKVEFEIKPIN